MAKDLQAIDKAFDALILTDAEIDALVERERVMAEKGVSVRTYVEYALLGGDADDPEDIADSFAATLDGEAAISWFETDSASYMVRTWTTERDSQTPSLLSTLQAKREEIARLNDGLSRFYKAIEYTAEFFEQNHLNEQATDLRALLAKYEVKP